MYLPTMGRPRVLTCLAFFRCEAVDLLYTNAATMFDLPTQPTAMIKNHFFNIYSTENNKI